MLVVFCWISRWDVLHQWNGQKCCAAPVEREKMPSSRSLCAPGLTWDVYLPTHCKICVSVISMTSLIEIVRHFMTSYSEIDRVYVSNIVFLEKTILISFKRFSWFLASAMKWLWSHISIGDVCSLKRCISLKRCGYKRLSLKRSTFDLSTSLFSNGAAFKVFEVCLTFYFFVAVVFLSWTPPNINNGRYSLKKYNVVPQKNTVLFRIKPLASYNPT